VPRQRRHSGQTEERRGRVSDVFKGLFSGVSLWVGALLLVLIGLFPPWRQEFLWREGDAVFPVRALRYRPFWEPPAEATLDVPRLVSQIVVLIVLVFLAYRFERWLRRPKWQPSGKTAAYSEADWNHELLEIRRGAGPFPCPACGRVGFYGPREGDSGARYRQCNFCGFRQFVGEAPVELRPCVHRCGKATIVAGAPLVTWIQANLTSYRCEFCREETDLADSLSSSPALDPHHPWWQIPQDFTRPQWVRFWLNNGAPGREYL
jgi:predicted RNA-binding Zn-ribbon protein involved in translation (DUF1610 family)